MKTLYITDEGPGEIQGELRLCHNKTEYRIFVTLTKEAADILTDQRGASPPEIIIKDDPPEG